jgi:hypothetical protein
MCYDYCLKGENAAPNITLLNEVRPKKQGQLFILKRLFSFANFTTTIQIIVKCSYKEKKKKV